MNFKQKFGFIILLTILMSGCSGAKNAEEKAQKEIQYQELKDLVSTKSYTIEMDAAYPLQTDAVMRVSTALFRNTGNAAGRIQLTGSGNHITIKGDKAEGTLSYFGEVQMAASLNPKDNGIRFNDEAIDYEIADNEKKQYVAVNFNVKGKREHLDLSMRIYPNKKASVIVNSSRRTSIKYDGAIKALDQEIADNN